MRYESTGQSYDGDFENLEADSFGEFARALLLGLGAILLFSAGTYLIFSGLVATLIGMVS